MFIRTIYDQLKGDKENKRILRERNISITRGRLCFNGSRITLTFIPEMEGPVGIPQDEGRVFKPYDGFFYDEYIETAWSNRKQFDVVLVEGKTDKLYYSRGTD